MSKIDVHKRICEELNALYARKNADYGDSFTRNYNEFGIVYPIMHFQEKLDRLKSITNKDAQVTDESITDTLMDLANYSIMTLVELAQGNYNIATPKGKNEPPERGDHDPNCRNTCQCMTCVRDNTHSPEEACCYQHIGVACGVKDCPDYVPEEG
jgi:hypothetical protein